MLDASGHESLTRERMTILHPRAAFRARQAERLGWVEQIGLVTQLAAQPRVPLTPRFEAPGNRVEEPGFARGRFVDGRLAEETRAQLRVPADVVTLAHLILEEPCQ